MIIKYTNYSDGVHDIELIKSAADLNIEPPICGDVIAKCKMDKSFHQIYIECDLTYSANMVCDRCNEEYSTNLENSFSVTYIFEREDSKGEDSSVKYLSHDVDKIDITDEVIEYSLLALPMKKLCSKDCKGLCPMCGKNLNEYQCDCKPEIDNSVWEPLKKLKDNNKNN